MHHCEVASIDRKRDLPPPPPPCKWIGPAEIPERTQVCTRCQPGETQGETILLWPQTPSRLLLLSKRREVVFIRGGYYGRWNGGGWFVIVYLWNFPSKNKKGSECRVSGRVNSVLGCTGSCGNMSRKQIFKKKWLQWRCNSELIMSLTSANIYSSLRKMPILDDDVVIMYSSDLIGWDNRGTKGDILGHLVLGEPVSE